MSPRTRGFSLIEATIVVAVLALAVGVVVAAVSNTAVAELRQVTGKLAGTIRATYDEAVLTSSRHRIVFDFEESTIKVEAVSGGQGTAPDSNALAMAADELDSKRKSSKDKETDKQPSINNPAPWLADIDLNVELPDAPGETADGPDMSAIVGAFFSVGSVMSMNLSGSGEFSGLHKDVKLGKDMRILDVWIEGMDRPASEGKVFLHFFPHGYTQRAIIHLRTTQDHIFAVKVSPLTAKTEIFTGYQKAPR